MSLMRCSSLPDPGRSRTYEVTRASKEAANKEALLVASSFVREGWPLDAPSLISLQQSSSSCAS
jgi:hypothetical protein